MKMTPKSFEKLDNGKIKATWISSEDNKNKVENPKEHTEEFDTVLLAIGRHADTEELGLESVGVTMKEGKIVVDSDFNTNVESIYSVGDCIHGSKELTPVAINEGRILADRIYGNTHRSINYDIIATTVFTPLEYGCIGFSEEDAIEKFGTKKY